jgi:type II secretory pathway component GspD/PulD (secretin)
MVVALASTTAFGQQPNLSTESNSESSDASADTGFDAALPITAPPVTAPATAAPANDAGSANTESANAESANTVRFSFSGVPWRDVISWIAEEADLALHVDSVPAGSFTYSDPATFTYDEAIDRINLFLLPQGYSLVRNDNLLSVINMSDPRSMRQLDALAELVSISELDSLNSHDVVKCLFPLGELEAEEAVDELEPINLMMSPSVFSKTNQLMVTDTVAKLRNVKKILESFEPSTLDNGTVVKSFNLDHVTAEDVLVVARPHLGLATGEMIGIDVSISADVQGKHLFVTGVEDKVKLIENLVQSIDVPTASITDSDADAVLQTHKIAGGNVDLAYDVLQTLLVGRDVRLSKDETAGSVVALATPKTQQEIAMTIEQLAAEELQFEVIPLNNVDPVVAIGLIEQMLDLPDEYDRDRRDRDDDDMVWPKIDADPANRRLFVRAKPQQIEEIRRIVEGLDERQGSSGSDEELRLLSINGRRAEQALQLAARFWRLPNPIIFFKTEDAEQSQRRERVVHSQSNQQPSNSDNDLLDAIDYREVGEQFVSATDRGKLLSSPKADASEPAIECQLTSRGLLIQCDDPSVLDKFEDHLSTLAGTTSDVPAEPVAFYLKYTRPADALRMLAELLDGGAAVAENTDSLVNASITNSSGSFLGSIVTNRDGTLSLIADTATVVADPRLNRLIAQGTTQDIEIIEEYLKIIEKDSSITSVETFGRTKIIELENTRASEVEAALRQAFAGRIAEAAGAGAGGAPGGQRGNDPRRDRDRDDDRDNRRSDQNRQPSKGAGESEEGEPKIVLAVHEPSNSLIATAPEDLLKEVEMLAREIDQRGEQTIQVITPSNSEVLESVLQQIVLGQTGRSSSRSRSYRDNDRDRRR